MNTLAPMTTLLAQGGGAPGLWIWLMAIGFVAVCLIMMLVVLIQKPKGGGLSGAFGGGAGGGSTQAVIGARVGDVLTIVTVVCFVLFLLLACGMTLAIHSDYAPAITADAAQTDEENDGNADSEDADEPATPDGSVTTDDTPEPDDSEPATTDGEGDGTNPGTDTPDTNGDADPGTGE